MSNNLQQENFQFKIEFTPNMSNHRRMNSLITDDDQYPAVKDITNKKEMQENYSKILKRRSASTLSPLGKFQIDMAKTTKKKRFQNYHQKEKIFNFNDQLYNRTQLFNDFINYKISKEFKEKEKLAKMNQALINKVQLLENKIKTLLQQNLEFSKKEQLLLALFKTRI